LPAGVSDLSDNMWASETYTCPLLITGSRPGGVAQIACRQHISGSTFKTVIAEGDSRLTGTRLAIPATANNDTGRYLTSMIRPGARNLYFTSITGSTPQTVMNQVAWRFRDYTALERVVGAGDQISVKVMNGTNTPVTLTAAGPIDANVDGREFI